MQTPELQLGNVIFYHIMHMEMPAVLTPVRLRLIVFGSVRVLACAHAVHNR